MTDSLEFMNVKSVNDSMWKNEMYIFHETMEIMDYFHSA